MTDSGFTIPIVKSGTGELIGGNDCPGVVELIVADVMGKIIFFTIVMLFLYFVGVYLYDNYIASAWNSLKNSITNIFNILKQIFAGVNKLSGGLLGAGANIGTNVGANLFNTLLNTGK